MVEKYIFRIVFFICLNFFSSNAFCYDDKITHPDITEIAIDNSGLGVYLKNNLGLMSGIDTKIPANSQNDIRRILMEGSKIEDTPNCRAASHFLNPLKDWAVAGVTDTSKTLFGATIIDPGCFVLAPFSDRYSIHKYSDVTWATGYTSPPSSTSKPSNTGNDMDWNAARTYYKLALIEPDKSKREKYFAKAFQALGQVMHLVQDMAVPAHVRNDFTAHLVFQRVEGLLPNKWIGNTYEWYVKDKKNAALVKSAMANPDVVAPPDLLTSLWDADKYKYDGSNPSTATDQGLAEYTNANFFSESTIFAELKDKEDIHYFPRPAKADTNAAEVETQAIAIEITAEDGLLDKPIYVLKNNDNYKLAAYSFFKRWVEKEKSIGDDNLTPTFFPEGWVYNLDDEVYKDYAKLLIPRAVGYSAALIDYFFRGKIDLVADPGNAGKYVIKNESDEDLSGTFTLYYDDSDGIRKPVTGATWVNLGIAAKGTSNSLNFTAPNDAKEAGKYMLVFNGAHGAEIGAVVGKEVTLIQDNKIRIRLYDPDGTQIRRDVLFNVWAYRADTGAIGKVVAATWQYNDSAQNWEITVPSQSATMVYDPKTNYWSSSTPSGRFDLNKGVYLDYLWKAGAVGVAKMTYYGPYQWNSNLWAEEENRNLATQLQSLWFKVGYKPKVQPIPGIEVLRVYPVGEYQIKLIYDPETKEISLDGASKTDIKNNSDAGLYGLSIPGYSAVVVKVSPSALPSTRHVVDFGQNSGRLDKNSVIRAGSPWVQYPGNLDSNKRFIQVSKINLSKGEILEDTISYFFSATESHSDGITMHINSNIDYSLGYYAYLRGAGWSKEGNMESSVILSRERCGWHMVWGDSSNVIWELEKGSCTGNEWMKESSWLPTDSVAWVNTDNGTYDVFPGSYNYKKIFSPGSRVHYMQGGHSLPSHLRMTIYNSWYGRKEYHDCYLDTSYYPLINTEFQGPLLPLDISPGN